MFNNIDPTVSTLTKTQKEENNIMSAALHKT
jgi:hypothetical protein